MKHDHNHRVCRKLHAGKLLPLIVFLLSFQPFSLRAQEDLNVLQKNWLHFKDAPNSLYMHLSSQAYDLLEQRKEEVSRINTPEEWRERQETLKAKFEKVLGAFPEKTPLNAQIARKLTFDDFRLEHIVFESQPGFYVSSTLYIPKGVKRKAPAVIFCSGHAAEGYRSTTYQHMILNLVKKGFVVFAFDPVGQGERLEYFDAEKGKSSFGATGEHSYPGAQAFISGSSQAHHMIWDGIRAVDYLLTRREVDPERIGITGRSGGGTQSSYIAAIDDRIKAAAPENYITNFTRLLETNGPQDAEQNFMHGISEGLDHADLLAIRAPKPALMITTTRDIFNIQGARETAEEVARIYSAYGEAENFGMVEDDAAHASTVKNREAMYAFFQKHLDNPGSSLDEDISQLKPEELQVTATGQISTSVGGETIFSLNRQWTEETTQEWLKRRNGGSVELGKTVEAARTISGYRAPTEDAASVLTGRYQRDGYVVEKYYIKGEGDYIVPYLLMIPESTNNKAIVYLDPAGKSEEAMEGGKLEWFVKQGFTVLAADMIGSGEVAPDIIVGDSNFSGNSYNVWYGSVLIGRSIAGIRAGDLIRLTRMLKNDWNIGEIYGMAKREMAPVLVHGAAFDPSISRIALVEPLLSYRALVKERRYSPSFIQNAVAASLLSYDLPELIASLAPKKVVITNPLDATGKMEEDDLINEDIAFIRSVYQTLGKTGELKVVDGASDQTNKVYEEWIK